MPHLMMMMVRSVARLPFAYQSIDYDYVPGTRSKFAHLERRMIDLCLAPDRIIAASPASQ